MENVQQLPLVLVNSLDLTIEDGIKANLDAGFLEDDRGQLPLVLQLRPPPLGAKRRVFRQRNQTAQNFEIGDPTFAQTVADQFRKLRIAKQQPAALGDAIGLVVETFRIELKEISKQFLLENSRVQTRHAVDRMAADDGEVRHAQLFLRALLNQRHAPEPLRVCRETALHFFQKTPVDLIHDQQNARQNLFQQRHRPLL